MKKITAVILLIMVLSLSLFSLAACLTEECQYSSYGSKCHNRATWKGTNGFTTVYTCDDHKRFYEDQGREWKGTWLDFLGF